MNTQQYTVGQSITFRLDGRVWGIGEITNILSKDLQVKLTQECKEFKIGSVILISKSEVIPENKGWEDNKIEKLPFKRTNWSNDEVISILKTLLIDKDNEYNGAINDAIGEFTYLNKPEDDFFATGMNSDGEIVAIGMYKRK